MANVPELTRRLESYLKLRQTLVETLANQYLRGLDMRLNKAAADGNLSLVNSFNAEKDRVMALLGSLKRSSSDLIKSVAEVMTLPPLDADAPEGLVALRTTWTGERRKIRDDLNQKLEQSLKFLESDLTKKRQFVTANALLAWRQSLSLGKGEDVATPVVAQSPGTPKEVQPIRELEAATRSEPFVNSLGMKFVPVKDTEVLFCIHEVRNKDYAQYAKEVPGVDMTWQGLLMRDPPLTERPEDHPVGAVCWLDAKAFCQWLSAKEKKRYRLPTDLEWSEAVGIGAKERRMGYTKPETVQIIENEFPWVGLFPPPRWAGNYEQNDDYIRTAPVMSFRPNASGIYDLGGNAEEWCEDYQTAEQNRRVLRGGSWSDSDARNMNSSWRSGSSEGRRMDRFGFRIVVEISDENVPKASPVANSSTPAAPNSKPVPAPPTAPVSKALVRLFRELETATKQAPFVNSLGMKFVPVANTKVLFCIHETRNRDYEVFAHAVEDVDITWSECIKIEPRITERPEDHPVSFVSWFDANAFCAWLSAKEGKRYRLPTDLEWSDAVGIGEKERKAGYSSAIVTPVIEDEYPWGNRFPPARQDGNYNLDDDYPMTAPVMTFEPNQIGIYDLGGNAEEWCEDLRKAPWGRVMRGSSWSYSGAKTKFLSSRRSSIQQGLRNRQSGFRVVVEISDENVPKAPLAAKPSTPADPNSKPVPTPSSAPAPASAAAVPAVIPLELKAKVDGLVIAVKEKQWEDAAATSKQIREQIAPLPASIQLKVLELMTGDVARSLIYSGKQMEEVFAIREAFLRASKTVRGPDHEQTGYAMLGMSESLTMAGRDSESLALRESALAIATKNSSSGLMFYVKSALATSYFLAGRFEEALTLREEALPLARKVRGPEDVMTTGLLLRLSESYEKAERYDEAISSAEEVVSIRTKTLGLDKAATRTSIEHLIRLYEAAGKQDEADKMRKNLSPSESAKPPKP
ncbi:MAG: SUMF1/EgtB/PvdO family nonheme iron enzyme [Prosthecobacter sp.]